MHLPRKEKNQNKYFQKRRCNYIENEITKRIRISSNNKTFLLEIAKILGATLKFGNPIILKIPISNSKFSLTYAKDIDKINTAFEIIFYNNLN